MARVPISISAREIAGRLGAQLIGDGEVLVTGLCPLDEPCEGALTFSQSRDTAALNETLRTHPCRVIIVGSKLKTDLLLSEKTFLITADPMAALVNVIPVFYPPYSPTHEISSLADVHPTAKIGVNVTIGSFCVVGENAVIHDGVILHPHVVVYREAVIGDGTIIHSNAVVREFCVVGKHSVIQNGAVVGGDGFGYIPDSELGLRSVPQVGNVVLADRVDVGANSCIDRGALGTTEIGLGTKIDNLVQIGHNAKIGRNSIFCGQAGIAGSSKIGDQVVFGGQSGMSDHRTVCNNTRFGAKASVLQDIVVAGDYAGTPAIPAAEWRRQLSVLTRLTRIRKKLFQLLGSEETGKPT